MPKQKNMKHFINDSLTVQNDTQIIDKEDIILPWKFEQREMEDLGDPIECLESSSTQSDLSFISSSELRFIENIVGHSFLEKRETFITPPDDNKDLLNDDTPQDDKK